MDGLSRRKGGRMRRVMRAGWEIDRTGRKGVRARREDI